MAWRCYPGVQENFPTTIVASGGTGDRNTDISDIQQGCIRMIYPFNALFVKADGTLSADAAHVQMLVNHGKFVIVTIDSDNEFQAIQNWKDECTRAAKALEGIVSVVEVLNEPLGSVDASKPGGKDMTNYFAWLRAAIPIFAARGIGCILAGQPSPNKNNPGALATIQQGQNLGGSPNIWTMLRNNGGGVGVHPYWSTPGTTLSTGMLGYLKQIRDKLDGFNADAAALPLYLTELGYGNEVPGGSPNTLLCDPKTGTDLASMKARENDQADRLTQVYTNMRNHADTLKVKAAVWFWLSDWPIGSKVYANCGIRTHGANRSRVTGTRWKPAKAAFDAFGATIDIGGGGSTPPSCTTDPATTITQTSAILNCHANPQGTGTSVYFDWGLTPSYELGTSGAIPIGNGSARVDKSLLIGGLPPGRHIYFRARAVNNLGDATPGGQQGFDTDPATGADPDATTGPATNIIGDRATLTGTVDPKGQPGTTWWFEWGDEPSLPGGYDHIQTPEEPLT